jgi:hypothetical protein
LEERPELLAEARRLNDLMLELVAESRDRSKSGASNSGTEEAERIRYNRVVPR